MTVPTASSGTTDAGEVLVAARALGKQFGSFVALSDISIDIRKGEILTLLGPSGCGKSTLMRIIAGFEHPTSGSLTLHGRDMVPLPPERRPVNMVFQRYALFPHLDVFDNVAFGLRLRRLPERDVRERVRRIIELVQLDRFADRWITEISGGQAQRVALARALVNEPEVLLLDEPLAALDLKIRHVMLTELKRIQQTTGTTFVYVTHDQDEAMILSNRVALMDHGRLVQLGTPDDLYFRPNSMFAARFLGETNVIHGKVEAVGAGRMRVRSAVGEAVGHEHEGIASGADVDLVLRPEAIRISRSGTQGPNTAEATVTAIRPIGGRLVVLARLSDGTEIKAQQPRLDTEAAFEVADTVHLSWPENALAILRR